MKQVLWAFAVPLSGQLLGLVLLTPEFGAWGAALALGIFSILRAAMLFFLWGRAVAGAGRVEAATGFSATR
jgi:hypothetical protein